MDCVVDKLHLFKLNNDMTSLLYRRSSSRKSILKARKCLEPTQKIKTIGTIFQMQLVNNKLWQNVKNGWYFVLGRILDFILKCPS